MPITLECLAARIPELGGSEREAFVLAEILGQRGRYDGASRDAPEPDARPPLCLGIAIDASSSMRGPRFALALQSARNVVDSLGPGDRLTVVTFDRGARVVLGPLSLDAQGRASARSALDRLATGIGTNLGGGWSETAEALSRVMIPDAERRVLVLTDGYPSRGETSPEALRARIAEGRTNGIETTVVGIGDGIDERLCSLLSTAGDGRFHYVRDEGMLGEVVASEVQGALSIAARSVTLSLGLSQRTERAEVLHRYACRPEGRSVEVRVGTVTYEFPRKVLAVMTVSHGSPEPTLGQVVASGRRANAPRNLPSAWPPKGSVQSPTVAGYALGARDNGDPDTVSSETVTLTLASGNGPTEARRRIAHELLTQRTLTEIRSAWDALDSGNRDAILRRLARARALRKVLSDCGLVDLTRMDALPDVDIVQEAMLGANANARDAREARRRFTSWAHNTQVSFIGPAPAPPREPEKK